MEDNNLRNFLFLQKTTLI